MDNLLRKLGLSVEHLTVVHETLLRHSSDYKLANDAIVALGLQDFERQLYAGGKVRRGPQRQMILADIFQYIFVGRAYYTAVESAENLAKFIELLFRVSNLLVLQENLSVDADGRLAVIKALERTIPPADFIEPGYPVIGEQLKALKLYRGKIVGSVGKDHENVFDSLLPKRLGLATELLVYGMLLLRRCGYVVPLLMNQRLIQGGAKLGLAVDYLAPPDFLLLRDKGQIFGVEVGSGKDDQNAKFSTVTSIPLFAVRLGDHREPQPYRCGACGRWICYSGFVIKGLTAGRPGFEKESYPADEFFESGMPGVLESDLVFFGVAKDGSNKVRKLRYHYLCVKTQKMVKKRVEGKTRHKTRGVLLPIPLVRGLEWLRDESPMAK